VAVAQLDFDGNVVSVNAGTNVDSHAFALILDVGIGSVLLQPLRNTVHPPLMGDAAAAVA